MALEGGGEGKRSSNLVTRPQHGDEVAIIIRSEIYGSCGGPAAKEAKLVNQARPRGE